MIKSYFLDNKKYYEVFIKVTDQKGRQIARRKRGIVSERQAKDCEFRLRQELEQILTGQKSSWLWREWFAECIKRMRLTHKNSTVINYEGRLGKWLPNDWGDRELSTFTASQIFEVLFNEIKPQVSAQLLKGLSKMLRRIFQIAVDDGILLRNPCVGIRVDLPPSNQKVLTAEEAQMLLGNARSTNHRFYPIWAFALFSGMRSGEMYALKWSDIDLAAGIISVTRQWTSKDGFGPTKTRESRVVPINDGLKALILELKNNNREAREFALPHLREWTNGEQALVLRDFCKSISITDVKFHDLRATFITNMLSQGVPLVKVMAIVGHRKMSTTDIYLRLAGVNVKGATQALGYSLPTDQDENVIKLEPRGQA